MQCAGLCICESVCVEEREKGQEEERERERQKVKELGDLRVWTYCIHPCVSKNWNNIHKT